MYFLVRRSVSFSTAVFCTAGVSHGLDLACRQLGSPGDQILVESPTYFLAGSILKQAGLQPVSELHHGQAIEPTCTVKRYIGTIDSQRTLWGLPCSVERVRACQPCMRSLHDGLFTTLVAGACPNWAARD